MSYQIKDKEGKPVIKDGKNLLASDRIGLVKAVDSINRTLTIVGTDETQDRDGDVISMKGWVMDNFLKNPVFLYAHDYHSVPIGAAIKVIKRKNPSSLEFVEKFPTKGVYPFADMILELFNEKILNASSVGFIPMEWEPLNKDSDPNGWEGRIYTKQELLELSACPVPSNPAALQTDAYIKAFNGKSALEVIEELKGRVSEDDVLNELLLGKNIEFEEETVKIHQVPKNYELEDEDMEKLEGILNGLLEKLSEIDGKLSVIQESINKQVPSPGGNEPIKAEEPKLSEEDTKVLKTITESLKEAIKSLKL